MPKCLPKASLQRNSNSSSLSLLILSVNQGVAISGKLRALPYCSAPPSLLRSSTTNTLQSRQQSAVSCQRTMASDFEMLIYLAAAWLQTAPVCAEGHRMMTTTEPHRSKKADTYGSARLPSGCASWDSPSPTEEAMKSCT